MPTMSFAISVIASHLIVHNPCSVTPWLDVAGSAQVGDSIGKATVATFVVHDVAFIGNEAGINSIRGTVTGDDALEVLSNREMRAYGWCFKVNGDESGLFANQAKIASVDDVIEWTFGYAHYLDGRWISMCTPTQGEQPPYICH